MTDSSRSLDQYVSDVDGDVFALQNLPEVVKGALFARYSRSAKGLRELMASEFLQDLDGDPQKAEALYRRVFSQYGDDSVAQLGGAHVALENISNLATKQVEWGRLAAYLEQSTRYIPYTQQVDGRWRYYRDPDIMASEHASLYVEQMDAMFVAYAQAYERALLWVRGQWPQDADTSDVVWRNATKAKALDMVRGMLPAATLSNVGMFATGQSYEMLLLRLRSSDMAEFRVLGDSLLTQLRTVIPAFVTRVDVADRGVVWSDYLRDVRERTASLASEFVVDDGHADRGGVHLLDWAPRSGEDAEVALTVGALMSHAAISERELEMQVRAWPSARRRQVIGAYVGDRSNRRHRPGRAFERAWYRFEVCGDYGAFRDLQRHRMLTIDWQPLTVRHGYDVPEGAEDAQVDGLWHEVMERSAALYDVLNADFDGQAQYAVSFAYRMRYVMQLNARALMQMVELRSQPQGHVAYRKIAVQMADAVRETAGHHVVADALQFVDRSGVGLERLDAERAAERRRDVGGTDGRTTT